MAQEKPFDLVKHKPVFGEVLRSYVRISAFYCLEGEYCAELDVNSYAEYAGQPGVLEIQGIRVGKTGWNSDLGKTYYKQSALIGSIVDTYG